MDATFALEGLVAAFGDLVANRDFEGAENLLLRALDEAPAQARPFVHVQFGRLYREWNKLTSAIDHLHRAVETVGLDPFLRMQATEELKTLKQAQAAQRP